MWIDHIGIHVKEMKKSRHFYSESLAEIGIGVIYETENCVVFGKEKGPVLELYSGKSVSSRSHLAFLCSSEKEVESFYRIGLKEGGQCNGKPGPRHYFPGYYSAYLIDFDGNNIEAVYHASKKSIAESFRDLSQEK